MLMSTNFDQWRIVLVRPTRFGAGPTLKVKKPETINYRPCARKSTASFREKIWRPTKDGSATADKVQARPFPQHHLLSLRV